MKPNDTSALDRSGELFIDALRGVAALMVLLAHGIMLGLRGIYGNDPAQMPEGWHWLLSSFGFGGFWVWAFFVISGLCIQQSIARSVERGTYTWGGYLTARLTRIYPLFLLGLALAVGGWWITDGYAGKVPSFPWAAFLASFVMLQLFTQPFPSFAPSWSLTNEMAYYLLWPLGLKLAGGSSRRAVILLGAGTLSVTAVLVFFWKVAQGGRDDSLLIPCWGISALFVIWLAGAWLGSEWTRFRAWTGRRMWLLSWAWLAAVWCLVAFFQFRQSRAALLMVASYLAIPGFVVLIAGGGFAHLSASAWMRRAATWLGLLSYPCYILHKPLMWVTDTLLVPALPHGIATLPVFRILVLIVPPLLAVSVIGPVLERRIMAWRKRVLSPRSALISTAAAPV